MRLYNCYTPTETHSEANKRIFGNVRCVTLESENHNSRTIEYGIEWRQMVNSGRAFGIFTDKPLQEFTYHDKTMRTHNFRASLIAQKYAMLPLYVIRTFYCNNEVTICWIQTLFQKTSRNSTRWQRNWSHLSDRFQDRLEGYTLAKVSWFFWPAQEFP